VLKLHVIPHEFTALTVEKIHGFLNGVKNDPVSPQGLTGPLSDSFDLSVPEILEIVVIIGGQFVLSHEIPPFKVDPFGNFEINIRL
jgi:hypothetical protein